MTKNDRLILGMLLGGICVFIVMTIFSLSRQSKAKKNAEIASRIAPASFDALRAAPTFHRLVYEDDETRVIELVISPGQVTPIFSRPEKTIEWITSGSPVVLSEFSLANNKPELTRSDTLSLRADQLNKAERKENAILQSINNIGTEIFRLYRVENK